MTARKKSQWHRRLHDFEPFDRIELAVVPRYKTSGLSGDEWRTSVQVQFFFKGVAVHTARFLDMRSALMFLPHELMTATCPIPDRVLELEESKCDQPGCSSDAVGEYRLKRLTSARGEYLDPTESLHATYIRRFCRTHLQRGDASREDADQNYEVLTGPGPDGSSNTEESPAAFGGIIHIGEKS